MVNSPLLVLTRLCRSRAAWVNTLTTPCSLIFTVLGLFIFVGFTWADTEIEPKQTKNLTQTIKIHVHTRNLVYNNCLKSALVPVYASIQIKYQFLYCPVSYFFFRNEPKAEYLTSHYFIILLADFIGIYSFKCNIHGV